MRGWLAGVLGALGVTALAWWGWDERRSHETTRHTLQQTTATLEATRDALALEAWRAGDVGSVLELTPSPHTPLARGLRALAEARTAPVTLGSFRPATDCADLEVHGPLIACATLGGVALYGLDGSPHGMLSTGPRGWQHSVALGADDTLWSGGDDRLLHRWRLENHEELERHAGFNAPIRSISVEGASLALGLGDGFVFRWDQGRVEAVTRHRHPVLQVERRGGTVVSRSRAALEVRGSKDATLAAPVGPFVLTGEGQLLIGLEATVRTLEGWALTTQTGEVTALASGRWLITGSADGTMRWWLGSRLEGTVHFDEPIRQVVLRDDLVVVALPQRIEVLRLPVFPPAVRGDSEEDPQRLSSASTGTLFASCTDEGVTTIWNSALKRDVSRTEGPPVTAMAAHGPLFAFGSADLQVTLVDAATGQVLHRFDPLDAEPTVLAFDEKGDWLAAGTRTGSVSLWSMSSRSLHSTLPVSRRPLRIVAFLPQQALAFGGDDGWVRVLSLPSLRLVSALPLEAGRVKVLERAGEQLRLGGTDARVHRVALSALRDAAAPP